MRSVMALLELLGLLCVACYNSSHLGEEDTSSDRVLGDKMASGDSSRAEAESDVSGPDEADPDSDILLESRDDSDNQAHETEPTDRDTSLLAPSCADESMIDDMESGSGHSCTHDGRNGVWYIFHDETSELEQWPPLTTPGVPAPLSEIPGGRDASLRAIHTFGKGAGGTNNHLFSNRIVDRSGDKPFGQVLIVHFGR